MDRRGEAPRPRPGYSRYKNIFLGVASRVARSRLYGQGFSMRSYMTSNEAVHQVLDRPEEATKTLLSRYLHDMLTEDYY
jgi:hypothetical protein